MKLNDAVIGAVLIALAVAVWVLVRDYPPIPGQNVGPALFPALIAAGLAGTGGALLVSGWRSRAAGWIAFGSWIGQPRLLLRAGLVVGALVFYIVAAGWLGFFITGVLILLVLFLAFGVARLPAIGVALLGTWIIHEIFYGLLRVPLPAGLFQPPLVW